MTPLVAQLSVKSIAARWRLSAVLYPPIVKKEGSGTFVGLHHLPA